MFQSRCTSGCPITRPTALIAASARVRGVVCGNRVRCGAVQPQYQSRPLNWHFSSLCNALSCQHHNNPGVADRKLGSADTRYIRAAVLLVGSLFDDNDSAGDSRGEYDPKAGRGGGAIAVALWQDIQKPPVIHDISPPSPEASRADWASKCCIAMYDAICRPPGPAIRMRDASRQRSHSL